ncbi:MAG: RNA polymerase subunit sigma-70, partial [Clostridia bacterium]|nr:RNA polymerase subunit sigma-70 [Clostridia bacterium]
MEDREIIALFFDRDEHAIAETEKKYGRYCKYIASRILFNEQDEEEVINDTYLKVWNTVPPNDPPSLKSYVGMICR